jgi:hypothetical protein
VGALNFLSVTSRPDITHAFNTFSQFLINPGINHYEAEKQIFQYLKGTRSLGIRLRRKKNEVDSLLAYADADWANCPESSRSISGCVV